uniref:Uncharacterized protein n=1 Tax=Neobodo designis TaxID=312471 RepID=A0A7S1L0Q3_NEODS|mmetsp:Transcript_12386/g.38530  ORF Transcript_12386/g.38530 Transcript_12386/m.38530 type:complete len:216 (+) Transcript_12386:180-827(+)|eukprot:CAMPEP_0174829068 /NCGR_PEP_ID=MMETSP1114-20130205/1710_1 /TAXON_ID=312471 /ORGANISM="Neobodo designis, Strain CCAP 1951/1" /LENGTH=215 /DNA_ID=CAMNT_0016062809 /DNA_START=178 /DNA_END=825 /DNA_ORIENTATION=-
MDPRKRQHNDADEESVGVDPHAYDGTATAVIEPTAPDQTAHTGGPQGNVNEATPMGTSPKEGDLGESHTLAECRVIGDEQPAPSVFVAVPIELLGSILAFVGDAREVHRIGATARSVNSAVHYHLRRGLVETHVSLTYAPRDGSYAHLYFKLQRARKLHANLAVVWTVGAQLLVRSDPSEVRALERLRRFLGFVESDMPKKLPPAEHLADASTAS